MGGALRLPNSLCRGLVRDTVLPINISGRCIMKIELTPSQARALYKFLNNTGRISKPLPVSQEQLNDLFSSMFSQVFGWKNHISKEKAELLDRLNELKVSTKSHEEYCPCELCNEKENIVEYLMTKMEPKPPAE